MKVKWLTCLVMLTAALCMTRVNAAVTKHTWGPAQERPFLFVENDTDNNLFVTPLKARDPRMTGANRWIGMKGKNYQQSLGYIDNGHNTILRANWFFDMWLDNSPASHPLLGLRCINWYIGCNNDTSLILPQTTDAKGFYGVKVPTGQTKWMHGMMSDAFYQSLRQSPVGRKFEMTINTCTTSVSYDASSGARCKDQDSGDWYEGKVTHIKAAHLKLIDTHAMMEVFINSDGIPIPGEGNLHCKIQNLGKKTGLSCRMVKYKLQSQDINNTSIRIFPVIKKQDLLSKLNIGDVQFSLDGATWKSVNRAASYYTFNEMKLSDSVYIFLSNNFFKQLVKLNLSSVNTYDLFNFRLQNIIAPESGWYEFSTSDDLIIKPRDFGISIISDEFILTPKHEGRVGSGEPSLDFGYIVTTSGKTAADEVLIKVTGPAQVIGGRSYCIFSSSDGTAKVPFPATLAFTTQTGSTKTYDAGCDDTWRDMTDALWLTTPWTDISGDVGQMDKTTVKFSIPMDNAISLRTVDDNGWFGEVSASGEIHVQATWRNIK